MAAAPLAVQGSRASRREAVNNGTVGRARSISIMTLPHVELPIIRSYPERSQKRERSHT